MVWQTVSLAAIRTSWLWITGGWYPSPVFSRNAIKSIWRVGASVFSSSMLNTLFLHIYSFVIGAWYSLSALGVYTQADKWSKMGSASISQILTASFVPLLAKFQNDAENFKRYVHKINRFAAFIIFPAMTGMAVIGTPLFHTLFGNKWDAAIILFQILAVRGIFVILISLYNNYLLSLGYARRLFMVEVVKDGMIFAAIMATVWFESVTMLVLGQLVASVITYIIVLVMTSRATGISAPAMLRDLAWFVFASLVMAMICLSAARLADVPLLQLLLMALAGIISYMLLMKILHTPELPEAAAYIFGRFSRRFPRKQC